MNQPAFRAGEWPYRTTEYFCFKLNATRLNFMVMNNNNRSKEEGLLIQLKCHTAENKSTTLYQSQYLTIV